MTAHVREELGAYVLDALDAAEAARVRDHLASCAQCRQEHERLAALPAMLDLLPAAEPDPPAEPPAEMEDAVVSALPRAPARAGRHARGSRLRGRLGLAAAGALAGAAATVLVLGLAGRLGGERPVAQEVVLTAAGSPARAVAVLHPGVGGTHLSLRVDRLPATRDGQLYEVWFVRGRGAVSAGTFTVPAGARTTRVQLTTAARLGRYQRIGITREPDGLDPARNGPAVLGATLPS